MTNIDHYPANIVRALLDELERAEKSKKLLEEIWLELGPYTDKLPPELLSRMQDYFGFNDSE